MSIGEELYTPNEERDAEQKAEEVKIESTAEGILDTDDKEDIETEAENTGSIRNAGESTGEEDDQEDADIINDCEPGGCSGAKAYLLSIGIAALCVCMIIIIWGFYRINQLEKQLKIVERRVIQIEIADDAAEAEDGAVSEMTDWDYVEALLESIRDDVRGLKKDAEVRKSEEAEEGAGATEYYYYPEQDVYEGESYAENPDLWNHFDHENWEFYGQDQNLNDYYQENAMHGWIGIIFMPEQGPHMQGAKLTEVAPGSPAEEAGLEVGDIIWAVDGFYMNDALELKSYIEGKVPGDTVTLIVEKGTKGEGTGLTEITATLGSGDY